MHVYSSAEHSYRRLKQQNQHSNLVSSLNDQIFLSHTKTKHCFKVNNYTNKAEPSAFPQQSNTALLSRTIYSDSSQQAILHLIDIKHPKDGPLGPQTSKNGTKPDQPSNTYIRRMQSIISAYLMSSLDLDCSQTSIRCSLTVQNKTSHQIHRLDKYSRSSWCI